MKLKFMFMCLFMAFMFTSCSLSTVDGDEEGVFIKQPWFFGSGGVDNSALTEGSEWKVFSTDFIKYKKVPIKYSEEFNDIASDDGTPLDLNAHIFIKIKSGKAPILHQNYGQNWYDNNIKEAFREKVRNFISTYDMRSLISAREIYEIVKVDIMDKVNEHISHLNSSAEFPIEIINVIVDKAKPNDNVLEELNNTAIYMQQKQTEVMRQNMQDERKKTEHKRALADKEYQITMGFTPAQFIALKHLELENQKIEMIKNKDNVNVDVMIGNSSIPTWNIKQ